MPVVEVVNAPLSATEEDTWAATDQIIRVLSQGGPLRTHLNTIRYNGSCLKNLIKSTKTRSCSLVQRNKSIITVPDISLHGKWLQRAGFEPGEKVWVLPFSELLIIIPQGQKASPKGKRKTS